MRIRYSAVILDGGVQLLVDIGLIAIGLVVIAAIIAANGYFVAQEFAYMSVDRSVLRAQATKGNKAAKRALKVTNRTSFMLSGAQLGITVTGLLVGYVAEPLVGNSLGSILGTTGIPTTVAIGVGTVIALVFAAVVQMIFAELFPKNLAIANPTPVSLWLARSTLIYLAAFGWIISLFDKSSNLLLRLIKVEPVHDLDISANAEDLEQIVEDSRDSGDLPEELFILLDRILDFPEQDVEHAMIPRSQADTLTAAVTVAEARKLMSLSHTRYPVLDTEDNPIGVVHLSDVLALSSDDESSVASIMRTPLVLPTSMKLTGALDALLESKNELACVIDEYGGFVGVLTIEDLGEELVGEISDEHDTDRISKITQLSETSWRVPGSVPVDELERLIDLDLPEGDWETLSGMLIFYHGGLPKKTETVDINLELTADEITSGEISSRQLRAKIINLKRRVPNMVEIEISEQGADLESEHQGGRS